MSWLQKLSAVYDVCAEQVGQVREDSPAVLLPLYHSTKQMDLEVTLDMDAAFVGAEVLSERTQRVTQLPVTEESGQRTSGTAPHPLFDSLEYIAGDYGLYCDAGKKQERFETYFRQLSAWCASPQSHPSVCVVRKYLEQRHLMRDLVEHGILFTEDSGALMEKWKGDAKKKPPVFSLTAAPSKLFVRFRVVSSAEREQERPERLWQDESLWNAWIAYRRALAQTGETGLDYATGEIVPVSVLSPKYIRSSSDGAKLITSNDSQNFTYRGRFENPQEAFCLGMETVEKAHAALRWLLQKQGWFIGGKDRKEAQAVVAFTLRGEQTIPLEDDSWDLDAMLEGRSEEVLPATLEDTFALELRKAALGYLGKLQKDEQAVVMGMDSATPGRLALFYYRELPEKELVDNVLAWHESCSFVLNYHTVATKETDAAGKVKYRRIRFVGAPAPEDILAAAYGAHIQDKLKKSLLRRLLPCITDGAALPEDIRRHAVARAAHRGQMGGWEGDRVLGVACALIRKARNSRTAAGEKEKWPMALEESIQDRSYLFGRALAYAQQIENWALDKKDDRSTNAERLQAAFAQHPARTMKVLWDRLNPYIRKLGGKADYTVGEMRAVLARIPYAEYNDQPLEDVYLLGYACQMEEFRRQWIERAKNKADKTKGDNKDGNSGKQD